MNTLYPETGAFTPRRDTATMILCPKCGKEGPKQKGRQRCVRCYRIEMQENAMRYRTELRKRLPERLRSRRGEWDSKLAGQFLRVKL